MPDKKEKFVPPLVTAKENILKPIFVDSDGRRYRINVDKVGYEWTARDNSGVAERVRIMLVELDEQGDMKGKKKQFNIPSSFVKEDFKVIFDAILEVKDKPLVPREEKKKE